MNHINRDEVFNKHLGGTLPELQPGRELTGEEIQRIFNESTESRYGLSFDWIAAELNKIRALQTGVDLSLVVKQLNDDLRAMTKERDDLAKRLNSKVGDWQYVCKERDKAQSLLDKLRSESTAGAVCVTADQVKAAIRKVLGYDEFDSKCELLADALSPKWIKCSDRMPELHQKVFWVQDWENIIEGFYAGDPVHPATTHWMPRHVPEPPKEAESELVKDLNRLWNESKFSYDEVMKAVKEFEKGAKK